MADWSLLAQADGEVWLFAPGPAGSVTPVRSHPGSEAFSVPATLP